MTELLCIVVLVGEFRPDLSFFIYSPNNLCLYIYPTFKLLCPLPFAMSRQHIMSNMATVSERKLIYGRSALEQCSVYLRHFLASNPVANKAINVQWHLLYPTWCHLWDIASGSISDELWQSNTSSAWNPCWHFNLFTKYCLLAVYLLKLGPNVWIPAIWQTWCPSVSLPTTGPAKGISCL